MQTPAAEQLPGLRNIGELRAGSRADWQEPEVAGIALGQLPPRGQAQMHTLKKMSNLL